MHCHLNIHISSGLASVFSVYCGGWTLANSKLEQQPLDLPVLILISFIIILNIKIDSILLSRIITFNFFSYKHIVLYNQ
ncbi:putative multicopper oxidase, copper-binding protein [Helianthus annuus]|uniref:Multicopper oxidase, copper-binding protein n=1 Tax=Helianthus annuus TaxID=4232 RepID=A0A9K3E745_HELAN|nr:putative multicopper oxidase, copper-binding protein [Helianthus annuus]KAJ0839546.1 putative multicopper oxidase, copper-binding protein [Helianthus annuus]